MQGVPHLPAERLERRLDLARERRGAVTVVVTGLGPLLLGVRMPACCVERVR